MNLVRISTAIIALALVLGIVAISSAQLPSFDDERLAVDSVRVNGGTRLYGFILDTGASELTIAVERAWLRATYPKYYEEAVQAEAKEAEEAKSELQLRLEAWIAERKHDGYLRKFLEAERDRCRKEEYGDSTSDFLVLRVAGEEVRKVIRQEASRKHIGGLAYQHNFPDVVTTPASVLEQKLIASSVDIENEAVDLRMRLPNVVRQSEREWAARQALIEYQMREPLDYQGTYGMLVRKTDSPDALQLMSQMMEGQGTSSIMQLGAELGLPEFKAAAKTSNENQQALERATKAADADGFRGLRVIFLNQSLTQPEVVVEQQFLAKEPSGAWFLVSKHTSKASASEQTPERMQRIQADPQVKKILDMFEQLGLAPADQIERALQQGAATQQALEQADAEFSNFLGEYIDAVDSPALVIVK